MLRLKPLFFSKVHPAVYNAVIRNNFKKFFKGYCRTFLNVNLGYNSHANLITIMQPD